MEKINQDKKIDFQAQDNAGISPVEAKRIREAIARSDNEKFQLFCRMMRIQLMLENAVVTHK